MESDGTIVQFLVYAIRQKYSTILCLWNQMKMYEIPFVSWTSLCHSQTQRADITICFMSLCVMSNNVNAAMVCMCESVSVAAFYVLLNKDADRILSLIMSYTT